MRNPNIFIGFTKLVYLEVFWYPIFPKINLPKTKIIGYEKTSRKLILVCNPINILGLLTETESVSWFRLVTDW